MSVLSKELFARRSNQLDTMHRTQTDQLRFTGFAFMPSDCNLLVAVIGRSFSKPIQRRASSSSATYLRVDQRRGTTALLHLRTRYVSMGDLIMLNPAQGYRRSQSSSSTARAIITQCTTFSSVASDLMDVR